MKKFEEPMISAIAFSKVDDVITTSSFLEPNKEGYTDNNDEYDLGSFLGSL